MIESVVDQTFGGWELILVDNGCTNANVRQVMREWSRRDDRIKVLHRPVNGNISAATNQAAAAARAEFLVLLDSDDLLDRDALAHVALYLEAHPDTDLVYSDEDIFGADGKRYSPRFKPDWSPELLLSFCYPCHLTAIRRKLYEGLGGMRSAFDGSQDHDFWLRASERTQRIGHVHQVLYHWRIVQGSTAMHWKPATFEAGRRAVEEAFHRRGVACEVEQPEWALRAGCAIFQPIMPDDGPSVAILISMRNHAKGLKRLLDSLTTTTYRNYRLYVVDNGSDDPATLSDLAGMPHTVVRIPNPNGRFNLAAINNEAASTVKEELLLFLSDDTEVINPRWLSQMVGWSLLPQVGAVGARLLYPDGRVQHVGIVHGFRERLAWHAFRGISRDDPGYLNLARVSRNCMAVTAACMLTPRALFLELGGFDEKRFAVSYNDADYCYRLGDAGYRTVYCAEAELYHHETISRGRCNDDPREPAAYRALHGHRIDPYFSPHLDPEIDTFEIRPTVVPISAHSAPVRLLGVTHNLNWEGAPRFEFELLSRLAASGVIDPVVVSPCDGPLRLAYEEAGIRIWLEPKLAALPRDVETYELGIALLAELIRQGNYEVVHANTLQSYWGIDAARVAGAPSVWSVHESEPWQSYFASLPPEIASRALSCLARPYRVVFSARSSAMVWNELNSMGNFDLIRFPLDVERFGSALEQADRKTARRELGLRDNDLCVLLLGTVCERKGQHDLLHAFAGLPEQIAREGLEYSRELERLASELPEDRRDRFHVVPETGHTARFWRAADLFCCTSRVESYPHVILEAMAAALPIITTPVFGISEQVRDSLNALFYQPGDVSSLTSHLVSLARDDYRLRSLAEQSRWALQGLPSHEDVDEQYRIAFQAAAESSAIRQNVSGEPMVNSESHVRRPVWCLDPPHHAVDPLLGLPVAPIQDELALRWR
jgi:GT2 family glycosyltransferase/glycosyltransferase involved in cell wall biosynthesis